MSGNVGEMDEGNKQLAENKTQPKFELKPNQNHHPFPNFLHIIPLN
jgi:hypothetical protein